MCDENDHQKCEKQDKLAFCLSPTNRLNVSFWKELCPSLCIGSCDNDDLNENGNCQQIKEIEKKAVPKSQSNERQKRSRIRRLIDDGFVLIDESLPSIGDDGDNKKTLIKLLRDGITQLHVQHQLPAVLILLFDETWELAHDSSKILQTYCHPQNNFNFDILAWYIPPGSQGFSPHRDRQPPTPTISTTFHQQSKEEEDGQSKFVTQWIALSEATPQNSCLYVIPKPLDPGYMYGDIDDIDPLSRALPNKESYQRIQALPRQPGQSILFTHRIIHWGSSSSSSPRISTSSTEEDDDGDDEQPQPRIAISFVCSDPTYEPPLINPNHFSAFSSNKNTTSDNTNDDGSAVVLPPFHIRLLLVCAQLLVYYQRFDITKATIKLCYEYCKQHAEELEENYRQKVFYEFVKAMKESTIFNTASSSNNHQADAPTHEDDEKADDGLNKKNEDKTDDDDDEDAEDAMLEEMLNAETGDYSGEFEDDYDELVDNGDDDNELPTGDNDDYEQEEFDLNATFGASTKNKSKATARSINDKSNSSPKKKFKTAS